MYTASSKGILLLSFLLASCTFSGSQQMTPELYQDILVHPDRPVDDRERDPSSKPAEILAFMQVKPGQRILDFQAGSGYFTELLSRAVGSQGHIIAHNHSSEGFLGPDVFAARYGNNRLPNTEHVFARHNDLELAPNSLDTILLSMVYHDTYWFDEETDWGPVDQQALLKEFHAALVPEGTIVVIDHQAVPGTDPHESAMATHRIDKKRVISDFRSACFELLDSSRALSNPLDDLSMQIFEESVYRKTDRFVLRFRKKTDCF